MKSQNTSREGCIFKQVDKDTNVIILVGCVLYVGVDLIPEASPFGTQYLLHSQDH